MIPAGLIPHLLEGALLMGKKKRTGQPRARRCRFRYIPHWSLVVSCAANGPCSGVPLAVAATPPHAVSLGTYRLCDVLCQSQRLQAVSHAAHDLGGKFLLVLALLKAQASRA